MKFSHSFRVSAEDIDANGHVNNVAYVRWIQDVAVAHWFSVTDEEIREKFNWLVVRHEIDYRKQAFENEEITATTWVGEATKVTFERFTEITRGEDLLVKARSVWCLIDRETLKPTRITTEMKELFS
ncbi:MAG: thioesterase family protein [Acidobacteriota bacterium]